MASFAIETVHETLREHPRRWLVTGAAGFIGSNIAERLLGLGQQVVGLDNFSTGTRRNVDDVLSRVGPEGAAKWTLVEGDIRDASTVRAALRGVDHVIHQAAIGSVPRSIEDPLETHECNVTGFVEVAVAAREAGVERVVYASSSAVYGDIDDPPNREGDRGTLLSPYASSKLADEVYAESFAAAYGQELVGLRYFNVFGPRQDPNGAYAAVIPRWIETLLRGEQCLVFGDGLTTRDFCFVDNVVDANLLAAVRPLDGDGDGAAPVFNIAGGDATSLNELYALIRDSLASRRPELAEREPEYRDFRPGDIRHSVASIERARGDLDYAQRVSVADGLERAIDWYIEDAERRGVVSAGQGASP